MHKACIVQVGCCRFNTWCTHLPVLKASHIRRQSAKQQSARASTSEHPTHSYTGAAIDCSQSALQLAIAARWLAHAVTNSRPHL